MEYLKVKLQYNTKYYGYLSPTQDHSHEYAIKSINCVFNKIANTEVHYKVNNLMYQLVSDWHSDVPVSIAEVLDKELRSILFLAGINKNNE